MTKTTCNTMTIEGYPALIAYAPDTELFRGEFTRLNGGADFYAESVADLRKEGELSLKAFLEMCQEKGLSPTRLCSGVPALGSFRCA